MYKWQALATKGRRPASHLVSCSPVDRSFEISRSKPNGRTLDQMRWTTAGSICFVEDLARKITFTSVWDSICTLFNAVVDLARSRCPQVWLQFSPWHGALGAVVLAGTKALWWCTVLLMEEHQLHCHVISCEKTPPILRGPSPLNDATIVWCKIYASHQYSICSHTQISKLVKSAAWLGPSYLLMLHSTGSTLHWVTPTRWQVMVKTCPWQGFTPSQNRKSGNDEKTTGPHEFELQCSDLLDTCLTLFREPTCKDRCQWTRSEHHPWHTQGQATKDENCGNPKWVYT